MSAASAYSGSGRDLDGLQFHFDSIRRYPLLSASEERELARQVHRGDDNARERLILSNLRLVVSLARRYQGNGLDLPELVQEGIVGLICAGDRFDAERGHKFSTYATPWIRKYLFQACADKGRTIRLPLHRVLELNRIVKAARAAREAHQREPTHEEIAREGGVPTATVADLLKIDRMSVSLEEVVALDPRGGLDSVAEEHDSPEALVIRNQNARAVRGLVRKLDDVPRLIIEERFGLNGYPPRSRGHLAKRLKISSDAVALRERAALERLALLAREQGISY